jgi:hypothetical protein
MPSNYYNKIKNKNISNDKNNSDNQSNIHMMKDESR